MAASTVNALQVAPRGRLGYWARRAEFEVWNDAGLSRGHWVAIETHQLKVEVYRVDRGLETFVGYLYDVIKGKDLGLAVAAVEALTSSAGVR